MKKAILHGKRAKLPKIVFNSYCDFLEIQTMYFSNIQWYLPKYITPVSLTWNNLKFFEAQYYTCLR